MATWAADALEVCTGLLRCPTLGPALRRDATKPDWELLAEGRRELPQLAQFPRQVPCHGGTLLAVALEDRPSTENLQIHLQLPPRILRILQRLLSSTVTKHN